MQDTVTTPKFPKGWHVSWMGRDKSDGIFIAQLKIDDPENIISEQGSSFVSRTGLTWIEALTNAILVIEKEESQDAA